MADIDSELLERTLVWCAEAGRQTTAAHVRAALEPLKWDELLAARALLADPPPLRPLGPFALADIARGAPADVAAERERAGRYGTAMADAAATATTSSVSPGRKASPPSLGRKKGRAPFLVRRASARVTAPAPEIRALPLLDELMLEEGRAVLARLFRRHGGKRARIVAALSAAWRRPDGLPVGVTDLDRLLDHHGMARAFETRERDEILHALRAAGGVMGKAAAGLGLDTPGLNEAVDRLGARADANRLREQRRRELRARGTLMERAHLVLDEGERLADLDLLEEFVRELRQRLPDHARALGSSASAPVAERLCRSLSLDPRGVERLAKMAGLQLDTPPARAPRRPPSGTGPRLRTAPQKRPGPRGPGRPPRAR